MQALCGIVHGVGATYMCVCIDRMTNMQCIFENNHAIYVDYMNLSYAYIVKWMYTCYVMMSMLLMQ